MGDVTSSQKKQKKKEQQTLLSAVLTIWLFTVLKQQMTEVTAF